MMRGKLDPAQIDQVNGEMLNCLFMTITNANFDDEAIESQIKKMIGSCAMSCALACPCKICQMLPPLRSVHETRCLRSGSGRCFCN